jgi:2-dehydro-3-deoxygluconokinase
MIGAGRIVCFGELLLRLSPPGRELLFQGGNLDANFGGAEANVAIGLSRLGHSTAMVSAVPSHAVGQGAVDHVRRHGVDASGIARTAGRLGLYFLTPGASLRASSIVYDRAGSSFAEAEPKLFDWPTLLDGAAMLHLSGITPALGQRSADMAIAAARAARAAGIIVSFDGNYRPSLWQAWNGDARAILSELVGMADILFGNHRDVALLLDKPFDGDGPDRRRIAAEAAFEAFPTLKLIASTARHVVDADHHRLAARIDLRDGAHQTEEVAVTGIVDRIGGGDAFASGVLHGLISTGDPAEAARAGLALAALKHSLPGDASLFGPADIDAFWEGSLDVRR